MRRCHREEMATGHDLTNRMLVQAGTTDSGGVPRPNVRLGANEAYPAPYAGYLVAKPHTDAGPHLTIAGPIHVGLGMLVGITSPGTPPIVVHHELRETRRVSNALRSRAFSASIENSVAQCSAGDHRSATVQLTCEPGMEPDGPSGCRSGFVQTFAIRRADRTGQFTRSAPR